MSYESTTPNIKLPQWVYSDKPQMADFNTAFSRTDTAIGEKLDANNYSHIVTPLTTGTRSAFILTLDPALTAYVSGMMLVVNFHTDFSVGYMSGEPYSTININGLGAKDIQYTDSANAGQVKAGVHPIMYDSVLDGWILLDQSLDISGGTLTGALTTQDIVPDNNNSRNLGTDSKRYKSIKAFVGSFGEQITSQSGIFDNYLEVQGNEVWHNGEITSTTTTIKGGAGTSYTLQLYKIGRLVIISSPSWISLGSSTANGATLGTIPAGWRPASEAHGALIDADNDGVIRFATDGKILANNNASNAYCGYLCNVVYMTP